MGIAGPGPNTERQIQQNPNNLRIAPSSPGRVGGRISPALSHGSSAQPSSRSPTTPGSAVPAWMNVPLPPSDTSHQSHSYVSHEAGMQQQGGGGKDGGGSPTVAQGQGYPGRPFDINANLGPHGRSGSVAGVVPGLPPNTSKTAPGPPVPSRQMSMQATGPGAGGNGSGMGVEWGGSRGNAMVNGVQMQAFNSTATTASTESLRQMGNESDPRAINESTVREEKPITMKEEGKQVSMAGSEGSKAAMTLPPGAVCGSCGRPVKRQFVRAMGKVYHLDCFRCKDCQTIVAAKFFPVDDPDGSYPLCERDYFARLDLICGKCDKALRGSYITACNKKFHVEHFTCSVCPTVFGPQDSYYEHDDHVYCHFHYSTRFATKCVGCANAILKQFVEINRNQKDECWHPECYMIHKFWNVKLTSKFRVTPANSTDPSTASVVGDVDGNIEEQKETAETLREKQLRMENQVEQIWRVLSAFEESSAACISEMLRFVSGGQYIDAIMMAERFILHVEILFAAIDDLEAQFAIEKAKGMSHTREAKMLCRKTVNFFSLLTHTQDSPEEKAKVTQELLALVTGLAHYLKILIRIALTGSLKLEREHGNVKALDYLLARLAILAHDDGDPNLAKRGNGKKGNTAASNVPPSFTSSTWGIAYGYRSLAPEVVGESVLKGRPLNARGLDECQNCHKTVEEDCVRLGLFERWHASCLQCQHCDRNAGFLEDLNFIVENAEGKSPKRRILPRPDGFTYLAATMVSANAIEVAAIFCSDHRTQDSTVGFDSVSRLEQFAFLLNIALRRLWDHLRHAGVISASSTLAVPVAAESTSSLYDAYRDSTDIKRLKSVNLDRKLSATARMPQRSTIVESPSGKTANGDGITASAKSLDAQSREISREPSPKDGAIEAAISANASTGTGERPGHEIIIIQPSDNDEGAGTPSRVDILRPTFGRNNTQVCIVSESSVDGASPDTPTPRPVALEDDDSPFNHEHGVTLGDIPALVEAEQAKLDHRPPPLADGQMLLSEMSTLDATIMKHFALLALTKSSIAHYIELEEMLELVEVRKNQWWNKLFKPGKDKKDIKRKGVFGVPLEILVDKTGSDSQLGATNAQLRVPEFIDNIISAMKQMDMSIEGIFRKNGNIKRLTSVAELLDRDASSVNLSDDNPVQLAALLKKFLRDLPDPLMTFRLHKLFCAAQHLPDEEERQRCLHLLVAMLPRTNRDTLEVLFVFLKWVASFSHVDEETGSRMDIQNLATVICPSILYAKGTNAMRDDSFTAIECVRNLIENQDEFYTVPKELRFVLDENVSNLFKDFLDLPPKDIFKNCSNYSARRVPSGRGNGPTPISATYPRDRPLPPQPGENGLSTYRSDGNLIGSANGGAVGGVMIGPVPRQAGGSFQGSGVGSNSRPQSWAEGPLSVPVHPGIQHQHSAPVPPASAMSVPSGSPSSGRRMWYPGHGQQQGQGQGQGRGSLPSSPVIANEGPDRRPSSSLDRAMSPSMMDRL